MKVAVAIGWITWSKSVPMTRRSAVTWWIVTQDQTNVVRWWSGEAKLVLLVSFHCIFWHDVVGGTKEMGKSVICGKWFVEDGPSGLDLQKKLKIVTPHNQIQTKVSITTMNNMMERVILYCESVNIHKRWGCGSLRWHQSIIIINDNSHEHIAHQGWVHRYGGGMGYIGRGPDMGRQDLVPISPH